MIEVGYTQPKKIKLIGHGLGAHMTSHISRKLTHKVNSIVGNYY